MESKKKIILVEDEVDLRILYAEVLRDEGFEVIEISDGKEAIDVGFNSSWDLMLLDVMIPKLDGISVLKLVKNASETREKPVILLTNVGNEHLISEAFEMGAEGYLIKAEITPDKILSEVQNYLC